jgi:hypothetical protein
MLLFSDFYAFYGSSALDTGVSSYLINSGLDFFFVGLLAGGSPAATHFSLLRQRKVSKRKATLLSAGFWGQSPNSPSLWLARRVRCGAPQRNWCLTPITYPAVLGPAGVSCKLACGSNRHETLYPSGLPLLSAYRRGRSGKRPKPTAEYAERALRVLLPDSASKTRPGWACAAPGKRDQGRALFEPQASLRGPPHSWRSAGCPKRSVGTQTAGRLFFGYFLLAKQKKVTSRRATPGQPDIEPTLKPGPTAGSRLREGDHP